MNNATKIVAIGILGMFLGAVGASIITYNFPQSATKEPPTVKFYLDGTEIPDATPIPWGHVTTGTYVTQFDVNNTGLANITIQAIATGLPSGWQETWDINNTLITPNQRLNGTLSLIVPSNATAGTYNWNLAINIIE